MSDKSLTAAELAKKFDVKPVTARSWLKKGYFPNAILEENDQGKIWRIPERDLETFAKPKKGRPQEKVPS